MRGVFRFERLLVLETGERAFDISRHGHVARAGVVTPFESQATIAAASPVEADFVGEFESGDQVLGIIAIGVANAEVVDDEAEDDVAGFVLPKPWSEFTGFVSVGSEELDELIVGEASGLR